MVLTAQGYQQVLNVGKQFYREYHNKIDENGFNSMRVISSNYSRTISSAEAFLTGVVKEKYEERDMVTQNVGITISGGKDWLLNGWRGAGCPNQKVLIEDQRQSEELKKLLEEMNEIRNAIYELTHWNISSFYEAYLLDDMLQTYMGSKEINYDNNQNKTNNEEYSQKTQTIDFDPLIANSTLISSLHFMSHFSALYQFYGSDVQTRYATYTLFNTIKQFFHENTQNNTILMLSGHDITLDGIFVALNLTSYQCVLEKQMISSQLNQNNSQNICLDAPGFAGFVDIELYNDGYIQLIYNGQAYPVQMIENLDRFDDFMDRYFGNSYNIDDKCFEHGYLRHNNHHGHRESQVAEL